MIRLEGIQILNSKYLFNKNINNNNDKDRALVPDNLYDYDLSNEGLDETVRGAEKNPEGRELKKLLDTLRFK